ncbi:MAG: hypothetical protein ACPGSD_09990 [Flavobacteriales bacterium]
MKTYFDKMTTIDFAKQIQSRPYMFFKKGISLSNLQNMLWVYNLNSNFENEVPFQYFNYWVKNKLNKFGSNMDWATAILEYCEHNEEKGFWMFYELLNEFESLSPISMYSIDINPVHFSFYYSQNNRNKSSRIIGQENNFILEPAAYHIKVFEFDYCFHSYHFDYEWAIKENNQSKYHQHFDNVDDFINKYRMQYGEMKWVKLTGREVRIEFKNTIDHCRNKNENII